ncbi:glycogen synthase GlgA [Roseobacter sinensis]|uniref:Glycogen synthase n=1 Tax=Roseobacter sinensis TaxID=2931391 RepID=A0ABT3BIV7_9RHOB|nr:glycogen synthase GlgA [Roseobacter sp. WL0113]MCV3273158.1 glycogen synthase GlgA [Roseobacter sp. WL0113]
MNLLFVASECAPFVKTGGLADVVGALPKALAPLGVSVRVMLPAYPALADGAAEGTEVWRRADLQGGPARLLAIDADGIDLLLLEAPHLYDRPGNIYLGADGQDWPDNAERFAALSLAAAEVAMGALEGWQPDIVHAHDWQAGLVPAYLHQADGPTPPCVMTIHNIAFQGLFDASLMTSLGLSSSLYTPDGIEYFGRIGFLKAGLAFAQKITTVSPTYARELMLPDFGMGLDGLLRARQADLTGILNGIDLDIWDPERDAALTAPYSAKRLKAKVENRAQVLKRFGLTAEGDGPLFCVISRLTTQKGLDLLLEVLPALVARGAKLAVLGSGDKALEAGYVAVSHAHPGAVGVIIGYDEPLSHLMQGGSDAILIPSRFEPCGLTQLYGLRYGTVPVVARTGGLADTVIDANEAALSAKCATGVQFAPVTAAALEQAIHRTCDLYAQTTTWSGMIRRAMRHPVGWDVSAQAYHDIYVELLSPGAQRG